MNASDLTELARQLENLIRYGTVSAVRSGECRVKTGAIETDWRPYMVPRSGRTRRRARPTIGEQVVIFSPAGDLSTSVIMLSLHQDDHPEPQAENDDQDLDIIEYPDGAIISYSPATGELIASGIKTAAIRTNISITLDTPTVHCTGDLAVAKRITSATAKIGEVEVTTHKHGGVSTGQSQTGGPQ